MIFSRHIAKSVKDIQKISREIQGLYGYEYEILNNINSISLIILFNKDVSKHLVDMASNDLRHNLSIYYKNSCYFANDHKLVLYLKSII